MRRQHNEWRNESKAHWTLHTHSKFQQIPNVNVVVGMRLNYYGTFSMQFMVGWDWPHQTLKTEVCASKTAKIQTRWKWMCIKSPHSTSSILLLCRPTLQCSMKSGDKGRWRDEKQVLTVFLRRLFVRLRIPLRQALYRPGGQGSHFADLFMDVIPRIWCFFFAFYPSSRGCKGQRRLNEIKQGGRHTNIAVSQICISGELCLKILVIMIYCFGQYKLMSFENQWEVVVFDWTS